MPSRPVRHLRTDQLARHEALQAAAKPAAWQLPSPAPSSPHSSVSSSASSVSGGADVSIAAEEDEDAGMEPTVSEGWPQAVLIALEFLLVLSVGVLVFVALFSYYTDEHHHLPPALLAVGETLGALLQRAAAGLSTLWQQAGKALGGRLPGS